MKPSPFEQLRAAGKAVGDALRGRGHAADLHRQHLDDHKKRKIEKQREQLPADVPEQALLDAELQVLEGAGSNVYARGRAALSNVASGLKLPGPSAPFCAAGAMPLVDALDELQHTVQSIAAAPETRAALSEALAQSMQGLHRPDTAAIGDDSFRAFCATRPGARLRAEAFVQHTAGSEQAISAEQARQLMALLPAAGILDSGLRIHGKYITEQGAIRMDGGAAREAAVLQDLRSVASVVGIKPWVILAVLDQVQDAFLADANADADIRRSTLSAHAHRREALERVLGKAGVFVPVPFREDMATWELEEAWDATLRQISGVVVAELLRQHLPSATQAISDPMLKALAERYPGPPLMASIAQLVESSLVAELSSGLAQVLPNREERLAALEPFGIEEDIRNLLDDESVLGRRLPLAAMSDDAQNELVRQLRALGLDAHIDDSVLEVRRAQASWRNAASSSLSALGAVTGFSSQAVAGANLLRQGHDADTPAAAVEGAARDLLRNRFPIEAGPGTQRALLSGAAAAACLGAMAFTGVGLGLAPLMAAAGATGFGSNAIYVGGQTAGHALPRWLIQQSVPRAMSHGFEQGLDALAGLELRDEILNALTEADISMPKLSANALATHALAPLHGHTADDLRPLLEKRFGEPVEMFLHAQGLPQSLAGVLRTSLAEESEELLIDLVQLGKSPDFQWAVMSLLLDTVQRPEPGAAASGRDPVGR